MSYKVALSRQAEKFLDRLLVGDRNSALDIHRALKELAENPRPIESQKLEGSKNSYRIKVKVYRVLYRIDGDRIVVEVFKIGHRREVYRDL